MILPGTARMPLVTSYWRFAVANVLNPDRRWPLALVLDPGPCPRCAHQPADVLVVLPPERPARN
jgi:hypothetical protein